MSKMPVIGFVGMTHLGINSAVASAERGFPIIAYDSDTQRIAALSSGDTIVVEPDLPEALQRNAARLTFTGDAGRLADCDVIYVSPDVPTDDYGQSDLSTVRAAFAVAQEHKRPDAVLVLLSQLPPGFTRGLGADPATTFCQVETLVFGRAFDRALNPERFIIGCANPAEPLPAAFETYLRAFNCPLLPMRYESAELAKISINVCLVASVTVANTLSELSENIGADWSEIAAALRLDARIGPKSYLSPGLGIAGGNLERDLTTVCRMADMTGSDARLIRAFIANSRYRRDWALRTLRSVLGGQSESVIAVLGLAYKENTHSIKNSPSLAFLTGIPDLKVQAFDPVVAVQSSFHPQIVQAEDALAACAGADVLAVMTPWPAFKTLKAGEVAKAMSGRIVLDPYRHLDGAAFIDAGFAYHALGAPRV